jgi:hypothetical protein
MTFVYLWGPALKPPALLCSKKRALELLISIYLFLGGGIPRGTPPGPPAFLKGYPRPVNSRIVKVQRFTGPKVDRIVWHDHVIVDLKKNLIAPTVSSLAGRGEFITLRFD